jgi:hypothetical protein
VFNGTVNGYHQDGQNWTAEERLSASSQWERPTDAKSGDVPSAKPGEEPKVDAGGEDNTKPADAPKMKEDAPADNNDGGVPEGEPKPKDAEPETLLNAAQVAATVRNIVRQKQLAQAKAAAMERLKAATDELKLAYKELIEALTLRGLSLAEVLAGPNGHQLNMSGHESGASVSIGGSGGPPSSIGAALKRSSGALLKVIIEGSSAKVLDLKGGFDQLKAYLKAYAGDVAAKMKPKDWEGMKITYEELLRRLDEVTWVDRELEVMGRPDLEADLKADMVLNPDFHAFMSSDPQLKGERIDAWRVMRGAGGGKPQVRVKPEAVDAVVQLRRNPSRLVHGITDDLISSLGGVEEFGFTEVANELNRLCQFLDGTGTRVTNLSKHIGKLKSKHYFEQKGFLGELRALMNIPEVVGNEVTLQYAVANARKTKSFVDIQVNRGASGLSVEVKYYDLEVITLETIVSQFIQRDLFRVTSVDGLIWYMAGKNKLSKEQLVALLKKSGARKALDKIDTEVAASFLGVLPSYFERKKISDAYIEFFSKSYNFDKVFRNNEISS